ncbi:MAG: DJ-1/PfpI family protein [Candidatus Omnitrophica bacterium]|nr:DJ-1/PfpI family protein [Candidatus Omnitrophota bacterium]MCM8801762.1 DJ-1/PfpI family protein [Candidatus Omnitrophota bacterium]
MKLKNLIFLLFLFFSILYIEGQERRVLMIIAFENFRDEELKIPKEILERERFTIDIASTKKGIAKGMLGTKINVNISIEEIKETDYDGIIFVGGSGVQVLFNNKTAIKLAQNFYKNKKVIGAICLAPGILANAGILNNKKATCYYSIANILKEKGAIYTEKLVEVDGNIVTGSGPEAAEKFGKEILKLLKK